MEKEEIGARRRIRKLGEGDMVDRERENSKMTYFT